MKLVLGVLDVAYSDANGSGGSTTTGDVAEGLEERYQVMTTFVGRYQDKIAGLLADSIAGAIQDLANGKPVDTAAPTFEGEQKIEQMFRQFIFSNEMGRSYAAMGIVLSAAAEAGVNHRKKHPYAQRDARPAFVDTGTYVASFRAWTVKD